MVMSARPASREKPGGCAFQPAAVGVETRVGMPIRSASCAPAPVVLVPEAESRLRTVRPRLGALLALYWAALALAMEIERSAWNWPPHLELVWLVDGRRL